MINIKCEISLGELIDKISILRIKAQMITDPTKLIHVKKEEQLLRSTLTTLSLANIDFHLEQMIEVNKKLWKIEDDIRDMERERKFDQGFIELARAVYVTNDERFKRKNLINTTYSSGVVEVKSYKEYK